MDPPKVADHRWSGSRRRWLTPDEQLRALGRVGAVDRVPGTLLPGLRDHHVHLGLVSAEDVGRSALSAVDDLGWGLPAALDWQRHGVGGCLVRVAGPFLTAPGGYPVGRPWAPSDSVVELSSPDSATVAVGELARAGVGSIKIALNAAMPLLDDTTLAAAVAAARDHRLPVVVHAEGRDQPARALTAGADALAHTPWTERLDQELIEQLAKRLVWISTLAIHRHDDGARAVAVDNLARFHRSGGRIRYGTDMGNGPTPVGYNRSEVEALLTAGLDLETILDAICRAGPPGRAGWSPEDPPGAAAELPYWLATVRREPTEESRGGA